MTVFAGGRKAGFTLLEILVVVLIMGILSSIAVPNYRRAVERTRVAEAQTMLRAIYDSRERVAWERQYDSYSAIPRAYRFGFDKLDMTAKGAYSGENKTVLTTPNFEYNLAPANLAAVTAKAIKGDYAGATVTFNGQKFTCADGPSGEAAKACKVWGAATWND